MKISFPVILLGLYALLFSALSISPFDRAVWWAENIPILIIIATIIIVSRYFEFSNTSYLMMFILIVLHTIGGHFTFEKVPFDYITDLFGFERNHYDRIAHFTVGFYAFPIAEIILGRQLVRSKTILFLFPVFTILSVAAIYEIIEWLYAIYADEAAGLAMLGSQGDIWDAQKDMLADGLGAICAIILFWIINKKTLVKL